MLTQLNPPLPMQTSKGPGLAHFVIDYGPEAHLLWVVFMNADGVCWTIPNPEIRLEMNWSMQRREMRGRHTPAMSPPPNAQSPENVVELKSAVTPPAV